MTASVSGEGTSPGPGRRQTLKIAALGALGGAGVTAGGVAAWRAIRPSTTPSAAGPTLRQPEVLAATDGVLEVRLTAARGAELAGRMTGANGFNGTIPGPTLRVRPGDLLRIDLVNELGEPTNLHTHGLHVSPEGNADNIFRHVMAGETARYEYAIPENHPTGTFWYHPHVHGAVTDQTFSGLYGAIVVGEEAEPGLPERVLVVSDITLTPDGDVAAVNMMQRMEGREGDLVLVNGQQLPRIDLGVGRPERWRIINACTARFLSVRLDGHTVGFLGYDGQGLGAAEQRDAVTLAPGNRADLVAEAPRAGTFALRTLAVERGGMGMMRGRAGLSQELELASVVVSAGGSSGVVTAPSDPAPVTAPLRDLRGTTVTRRRTLAFSMGMGRGMGGGMGGAMSFGFDGLAFDPERVDQHATLGTVEEWVIQNPTPMAHPFHLHVWPMQVIAGPDVVAGARPDWRDVVLVPAMDEVTVRIPIEDFGGRTVYHCHVLDHEDLGMMGIVEVTA